MRKLVYDAVGGVGSALIVTVASNASSFCRTLPTTEHREFSGGTVRVNEGFDSVGLIPSGNHEVILVGCGDDSPAESGSVKQEGNQRYFIARLGTSGPGV